MRLDECYALLEVSSGASEEELKRAHRDLTKVWHPDRFAHDAALRLKAEEKLKAINDAYETILASRRGGGSWHRTPAGAGDATGPDPAALRRQQAMRNRRWALLCGLLAVFVLLRRPTPGGLVIALLLLCAVVVFVLRIRAAERG